MFLPEPRVSCLLWCRWMPYDTINPITLETATLQQAGCILAFVHHDDVIKWKHFPRYWPFVRGIHRSPVNSPHKGQWRGALMFSLNKRLSKQSWGWWFESLSYPLWGHCNGATITNISLILVASRWDNLYGNNHKCDRLLSSRAF